MSAIRKQKVQKIQSEYVQQYEMHEMTSSRKKILLKRRLIVLFALVLMISYGIVSTLISQSATIDEISESKKHLDQDYKALQRDAIILQEEIVKLNDDEYIAKLARKDYFLSDDGEIIFSIPETKEKSKE